MEGTDLGLAVTIEPSVRIIDDEEAEDISKRKLYVHTSDLIDPMYYHLPILVIENDLIGPVAYIQWDFNGFNVYKDELCLLYALIGPKVGDLAELIRSHPDVAEGMLQMSLLATVKMFETKARKYGFTNVYIDIEDLRIKSFINSMVNHVLGK